jgi:hypothetical protein
MGKTSRSGSGMNIADHISESLGTIFWAKILEFFYANPDPGSGIFSGFGIRDKIRTARIIVAPFHLRPCMIG